MNIAFCGDWSGRLWSQGVCKDKNQDCAAFVKDHPSEFVDTYWLINSLKVYQQKGVDFVTNGA